MNRPHPPIRRAVLALAALLVATSAVPAFAGSTGACGGHAALARHVPAPHPNAANRAKAQARRAVPQPAAPGMVAVIDPQTGQLAPATPAEIAALAGAKASGSATIESVASDVEVVRLPDGTLMANVPAALRLNAVAHRDASGKVTFTCETPGAGPVAPVTNAAPATQAPWVAK